MSKYIKTLMIGTSAMALAAADTGNGGSNTVFGIGKKAIDPTNDSAMYNWYTTNAKAWSLENDYDCSGNEATWTKENVTALVSKIEGHGKAVEARRYEALAKYRHTVLPDTRDMSAAGGKTFRDIGSSIDPTTLSHMSMAASGKEDYDGAIMMIVDDFVRQGFVKLVVNEAKTARTMDKTSAILSWPQALLRHDSDEYAHLVAAAKDTNEAPVIPETYAVKKIGSKKGTKAKTVSRIHEMVLGTALGERWSIIHSICTQLSAKSGAEKIASGLNEAEKEQFRAAVKFLGGENRPDFPVNDVLRAMPRAVKSCSKWAGARLRNGESRLRMAIAVWQQIARMEYHGIHVDFVHEDPRQNALARDCIFLSFSQLQKDGRVRWEPTDYLSPGVFCKYNVRKAVEKAREENEPLSWAHLKATARKVEPEDNAPGTTEPGKVTPAIDPTNYKAFCERAVEVSAFVSNKDFDGEKLAKYVDKLPQEEQLDTIEMLCDLYDNLDWFATHYDAIYKTITTNRHNANVALLAQRQMNRPAGADAPVQATGTTG